MIYDIKLTYDSQDIISYHQGLEKNYSKLHWHFTKDHNDPHYIDGKNNMADVHGWGLHTIYDDMNFPYHCDIDPHNEGPEYFKKTPMIHGFAEKLFDKFIQPYRSFLMIMPPGNYIGKWLPSGPRHGKMVLPITTNDNVQLISHETPMQVINPTVGNSYLVDFNVHGEFRNEGTSDFTFIVFNVPKYTFEHIFNLNEHI